MTYVQRGQKELRNDWPFTTGLTATTKHEGRQINLIAQGKYQIKTRVASRTKRGIG